MYMAWHFRLSCHFFVQERILQVILKKAAIILIADFPVHCTIISKRSHLTIHNIWHVIYDRGWINNKGLDLKWDSRYNRFLWGRLTILPAPLTVIHVSRRFFIQDSRWHGFQLVQFDYQFTSLAQGTESTVWRSQKYHMHTFTNVKVLAQEIVGCDMHADITDMLQVW